MAARELKTQCKIVSRELNDIARKLEECGAKLQCGWFADASPYPDKRKTPVALVAICNEFGTSKAPARPFVRPAIAESGDRWLLHFAKGVKRVLDGKIADVKTVMSFLGAEIVADLKDSIMRVWSPPLSPRTVAARRSKWNNARSGNYQAALYKPLIDTKHMIEQVAWRVKGGE